MTTIINVADLVNPESGLTFRQENVAKTHKFQVGDFVRVKSYEYLTPDDPDDSRKIETIRDMFVFEQTRDCDQTPLYTITTRRPEDYKGLIEIYVDANKNQGDIEHTRSHYTQIVRWASIETGYAEEDLTLLGSPITGKVNSDTQTE